MRKQLLLLGTSLLVSGIAACSDSTSLVTPSTADFAKGPANGGGTDVPPPTATTTQPTIAVQSPNTSVFVEQPVAVTVIATSESNNRNAPVVTISGAPTGFAVSRLITVDSPHGGGPGYTEVSYSWTPAVDQIGLSAHITITAATRGGSTSTDLVLASVQNAPSAVTGLVATAVDNHIEAHWNASTGGVGQISYTVTACYENANIRPIVSTCDIVATTSATEVLDLPRINPAPTVAPAGGVATYFLVMVTAHDANGTASTPVSVDVQ